MRTVNGNVCMNREAAPQKIAKSLLFAVSTLAMAQAIAQIAPNAGSILQQITPAQPATPSSAGVELRLRPEGEAALPASAPFEVQAIRISGHTQFETAQLHALVAEGEGRRLTLAQVSELVARITEHYRRHGYPLARAIIPAQTIEKGVVRIEVIEAHFGAITLRNGSHVADPLPQATLASLQNGQLIEQASLDRTLLLLSDIPGVTIDATLKPGSAVGSADLQVELQPGPVITGHASLDNNGNRYTGRARLGATVQVNNPMGWGDVLSLGALTSGGGLNHGRIGYEALLNGEGTRLGGAYSALRYRLGDTLAPLNARGSARITSVWAKHPLVRRRDLNFFGLLQFDQLRLSDAVEAAGISNDRHLNNWSIGLSGDTRDGILEGGVNVWSLGWTHGRVGFDDTIARTSDAVTARTAGRFSKWQATLSRLQGLDRDNSLYLSLSGQWAGKNLDSSQKMSLGGPYSVRAYDIGAVSGDSGFQASAEWRRAFGGAGVGQWQGVIFIDRAAVTVNRTPWSVGANRAVLSGAGVGLHWIGPRRVHAKAHVATPVGSTPALTGTPGSVRAWVEIGARF